MSDFLTRASEFDVRILTGEKNNTITLIRKCNINGFIFPRSKNRDPFFNVLDIFFPSYLLIFYNFAYFI